jgi:hypothetical protein
VTLSQPPSDAAALYRAVIDEFERRGWRDDGTTALHLARRISAGAPVASAARSTPSGFRAFNKAAVAEIEVALQRAASNARQGTDSATDPQPSLTTNARQARSRSTSRRPRSSLALSVGILLLTANVVFVLPELFGWTWLLTHPNRFGIQGAAALIGLGIAWAAWRPVDRNAIVTSLILAAVIILVSLLGGPGASP